MVRSRVVPGTLKLKKSAILKHALSGLIGPNGHLARQHAGAGNNKETENVCCQTAERTYVTEMIRRSVNATAMTALTGLHGRNGAHALNPVEEDQGPSCESVFSLEVVFSVQGTVR